MLGNRSFKSQTHCLPRFDFLRLLPAIVILVISQWVEPASAAHGLPIVPGFEAGQILVSDNCLVCHTADRFTDKNRSNWQFTVDRMQDKPGYPAVHTPEEEESMLDYLMQIHGAESAPNVGSLSLTSIASDLSFPLAIKNAGDGTGWLYIVEQFGKIFIYDGTQFLPTPFLDISSMVTAGGEQGLLDITFHPDYTNNGFFYVHFNDLNGDTVIARFARGADPAQADPLSATIIFLTSQPNVTHNGGQIDFGPDGYLYIALGDGGVPQDSEFNTAQDLDSFLGKLLRIDVDNGSPYAIPPDNPFINTPGAFPEIWAYGLRNPFKFSFDRLAGDLFISDVGKDNREEVNFEAAGDPGGHNYGWNIIEGTRCLFVPDCNDGSLTLPILEYDHDSGDCSVIGGYRHRGNNFPQLDGIYFYGDLCSGKIRGASQDINGDWQTQVLLDTQNIITSFGEDENGNLYLADFTGTVYRIDQKFTPKLVNDFDGDADTDLLIYNSTTGQMVVGQLNAGVLLSGTLVTTLDPAAGDSINATGDFNGDQKADILSYNTITGEIKTLLLDGATLLSSNAILTVNPLSDFVVQGTGDFDGNGRDEIIVHNPVTGLTAILFMDATGTALSSIEQVIEVDTADNWTLSNTGDFDGDGKDDLLLYNTVTGGILIIFLDGSTVLSFSGVMELPPASGWIVQDTADFNTDGKTDLLLYNSNDGQTATVTLDGSTILSISPLYTANLADQETVINVSDYNADGKVDLLTHALLTHEVKVVLLDGNATILSVQGVMSLNPASGLTVSVDGYTVTGYSSDTANDNIFYVDLTQSGSADTDAGTSEWDLR